MPHVPVANRTPSRPWSVTVWRTIHSYNSATCVASTKNDVLFGCKIRIAILQVLPRVQAGFHRTDRKAAPSTEDVGPSPVLHLVRFAAVRHLLAFRTFQCRFRVTTRAISVHHLSFQHLAALLYVRVYVRPFVNLGFEHRSISLS